MHVSATAWRRLGAVVAAVTVGLALTAAASARPTPQTYVSLGDSIAFGYQPNLVAAQDFDPSHYRGYTEDYGLLHPFVQVANFGCPGETSSTLIDGGCPWLAKSLPLHVSYGGKSQLDAALAYLGSHPTTSLISVDVGSNDLLALVSTCSEDLGCIATNLPGTLSSLIGNYTTILSKLHAAAPKAKLVVFDLYNPLAVALPGSDQLLEAVNSALAQLAAGFGASVADAFGAINQKPDSLLERALVCVRTWECSSYRDIHPTSLGYWQLAFALQRAAR
jgi:lysophospholipase L1-like esterase